MRRLGDNMEKQNKKKERRAHSPNAPLEKKGDSPHFREELAGLPPFTEEVATVAKDIDIYHGWIKRLENPDPVLRSESAGKGLKLYDEVDRDAHAASVLQQRIMAVVGKEWEIIPAESASSTQEKIVADYVSAVLENCNFDQARQEILKAILYGFYSVEVIWKMGTVPAGGLSPFSASNPAGTVPAGGLSLSPAIKIKKLIAKHPRRFSFTPDRELRLITPANMIEGEPVPDRKFVVFTYGDSDNPYGRGLGQKLWWPVWFKKNGVKFWMVFLEKFGMPTIKGKYPPGTTPEAQAALMDAIEAIQSDTGIKIPDSMDIEFLEAARTGTVSHEQLCGYMDRQISKVVLGQTLTTEIAGKGSYAASQTHNDVRQEIIEADADLLDACLNDTLIPWIVDYNFPNVSGYPKIKTYATPKPNLKEQSEIDKTLVVDIGLPVSRAYFYETYGIPAPVEGEELVIIPAAAPVEAPRQFAEKAPDAADTADVISGNTASAAMPVTDDIYMAPLRRLVDEAKSLEDIRDRILDIWGKMDPESLGVIMARGLMLADMAGRYEVALTPAGEKT